MKLENFENHNHVRSAINDCLSGVDSMPSQRSTIMRKARGDIQVKRKLSVGFVLLIVLVLAAVTALAAITLNAFYEKTIQKEGENGLIQDWSAADQVTLVDWMVNAGVELDDEKVTQLHNTGLSEEEKSALAMEIITDTYPARDGILSTVDIIAKEKGPVEYWSLEDKAWFSELMLKHQPDKLGGIDLMPGESDITREQAIDIMYAYYKDAYGLARTDFDETKMSVAFKEQTWDDGSGPERLTTWEMNLWLQGDPYPLGISILPDGTVKYATGPYTRSWRDDWYDTSMADDFWTIEGMYQFQQDWQPRVQALTASGVEVNSRDLLYLLDLPYALPSESDINRDQAYDIARQAILAQVTWQAEYLTYYGTREAFLVIDDTTRVYHFVFTYWTNAISDERRTKAQALHDEGILPQRIVVRIDAATGDVLQVSEENAVDGVNRLGF